MANKKGLSFDLSKERALNAVKAQSDVVAASVSDRGPDITRPTDVRLLPIEKLKAAHFNAFFDVDNVDSLAEAILMDGLLHNLVVRPTPDGMYEVISGHRRLEACRKLLNDGHEEFQKVSCSVKYLEDYEAELALIHANIETRELSVMQRANAAARIAALVGRDESQTGKTRDAVAEQMGVSARTAQNLLTIEKKMIPEIQAIIDQKGISLRDATAIASLSEDAQYDILAVLSTSNSDEIQPNIKDEVKRLIDEKEIEKRKYEKLIIDKDRQYSERINSLEKQIKDEKGKVEKHIQQDRFKSSMHHTVESICDSVLDLNKILDLDIVSISDLGEVTRRRLKEAIDELVAISADLVE